MKVIDLLNKIANGEEVPKKIKYDGNEFKFIEGAYEDEKGNDLCYYDDSCRVFLNDEVEILEEKKIPEKWNDLSFTTMRKKEDSIDDDIHKLKGYVETIMRTQNEIIDYLNSKGDE